MKCLFWAGLVVLLGGCSNISFEPTPQDAGDRDAGTSFDGGDGGAIAGPMDAGLALRSACTVLNARRCEFLARCGLIGSGEGSVRDCLAWLQATSCGPSKWPAQVDLGTLRYDPIAAQLCADGWATRACESHESEPGACGKFLLPNAFFGQRCYDGYSECAEGVCRGAACPRSCQPRGAVDEVCRENTDCKPNLYCRLPNPTSGVGKCASYGAVSAVCDVDQPCEQGLLCSSGKCALAPTETMPCLGSACDSMSWCLSGLDGGTCTRRRPLGEACSDDVQCEEKLLCEVLSSQCVPKELTALGSVCGLRQSCPAGAVCLGASATVLGKCAAPLDAGMRCVSSNDCPSNLACVGLDGGLATGCGPRQAAGGRCAEDRDCEVLAVCRQSSCVQLPATGESCTRTMSCLFGPCVGGDGGYVCTEPFGPGAACSKNADCSSARCVTGKCLPSCTP
jgi:hypothetical protein